MDDKVLYEIQTTFFSNILRDNFIYVHIILFQNVKQRTGAKEESNHGKK